MTVVHAQSADPAPPHALHVTLCSVCSAHSRLWSDKTAEFQQCDGLHPRVCWKNTTQSGIHPPRQPHECSAGCLHGQIQHRPYTPQREEPDIWLLALVRKSPQASLVMLRKVVKDPPSYEILRLRSASRRMTGEALHRMTGGALLRDDAGTQASSAVSKGTPGPIVEVMVALVM